MTAKALWKTYDPILTKTLHDKPAQRNLAAVGDALQTFRAKLWRALEMHLKGNCSLIWTVTELFHEDSFLSIFHLMSYNNYPIQEQSMSLIFRINACRSELASYIMKSLPSANKEDKEKEKERSYITRKVADLAKYLDALALDEDPARIHRILPQHARIMHEGTEEEEEEEDRRHLAVLALRRMAFQENSSREEGKQVGEGLIDFCSVGAPIEEADTKDESNVKFALLTILQMSDPDQATSGRATPRLNQARLHALLAAGCEKLLMRFLCREGHKYLQMIGTNNWQRKRAVEKTFSICCHLYRLLIQESTTPSNTILNAQYLSPSFPELLLLLGPYCPEALHLLTDLVLLHTPLLQQISENYVNDHLSTLNRHIRDRMSKDIVPTLFGITIIISDGNELWIQRLIETLCDESNGSSLMSMILKLGFGSSELRMLAPDAAPKEELPVTNTDNASSRSVLGGLVRSMCKKYLAETDRATFFRSVKEILSDPPVDAGAAVKWQILFSNSKLLPRDGGELHLHLQLIQWLGITSGLCKQIRVLCRKSFGNIYALLSVVFIDQIEIRAAYVHLLRGLWFNNYDEYASDDDNSDSKAFAAAGKALVSEYGRALLYLFAQDLRIFLFLYGGGLSTLSQGQILGSNSKNVNSRQHHLRLFDGEEANHNEMHRALLSTYIELALLPCVRSILSLLLSLHEKSLQMEQPDDQSDLSPLVSAIELLLELCLEQWQNNSTILSFSQSLISAMRATVKCTKEWRSLFATDVASSHTTWLVTATSQRVNKDRSGSLARRLSTSGHRLSEKDYLLTLSDQCLLALLKTADDFSLQFGYLVDHLVSVKEEMSNMLALLAPSTSQPNTNSVAISSSNLQLLNPLYAKSFAFTYKLLSQLILGHCRERFVDRFVEVEEKVKIAHSSSYFHLDFSHDLDQHRYHKRWEEGGSEFNAAVLVHSPAYLAWADHGALLPRMILQHVQQGLELAVRADKEKGEDDDVIESETEKWHEVLSHRSDGYWMSVFCHGILRSHLHDIFNLEDEAEEIRTVLITAETARLRMLQEALRALGAVDLAVKHWLNARPGVGAGAHLIHHYRGIALSLGSALVETGTTTMQNAFVGAVLEVSGGFVPSLLSALTSCRQRISLLLVGSDDDSAHELDATTVALTVRLLHFLSMLCEGHNVRAQTFLRESGIVREVGGFVEEAGAALVHEMKRLLAVDDQSFLPSHITLESDNDDDEGEEEEVVEVKVIQWLDFQGELVDLTQLLRLSELVQQGFETLAEFCQGFVFENQVAVAKTGAINHIKAVAEFCGSFQLVTEVQNVDASKLPGKLRKGLQTLFTYQNAVKSPFHLQTSFSNGLPVSGNDPFTLALLHASAGDGSALIDSQHQQHQLLLQLSEEKERYSLHQRRIEPLSAAAIEKNPYCIMERAGQVLTKLEAASILLLQSLSEGSRVDAERDLCKAIMQCIPQQKLISNMRNYWERFKDYRPDGRYPNPNRVHQMNCFERTLAYDYYIFVSRICDMPERSAGFAHRIRDMFKTIAIEPDQHVARIEVREPDPKGLSVAYFPIPLLVRNHWQNDTISQLRTQLLYPSGLDDDSKMTEAAEDKIRQFLKDGSFILSALHHLQSLHEFGSSSPLLFLLVWIAYGTELYSWLTLALALLLNVFLLISVKNDEEGNITVSGKGGVVLYSSLLYYGGIAELAVCSLTLYSFLVVKGIHYLKERQRRKQEKKLEARKDSGGLRLTKRRETLGTRIANLLSQIKDGLIHINVTFPHLLNYAAPLLYPLLMVAFAALGVFHTPLWFSLSLCEVIRVSALLQRLFLAIYQRFFQLLAVGVLALMLAYAFAVGAYSSDKISRKVGQCATLKDCAFITISTELGVQGLQEHNTVEDILYNFAFVVLLQIVILALLLAVITESFWSLSAKQLALERRLKTSCFICSLRRDDLELPGLKSFKKHTKSEHNMWRYLWYQVHLSDKDPTKLNGIEQFCKENMHSVRWVPTRMARRLDPLQMNSNGHGHRQESTQNSSKRTKIAKKGDEKDIKSTSKPLPGMKAISRLIDSRESKVLPEVT